MSTTEEPIVAAEVLQEVDARYQAGQYLSAYEAGTALGPLSAWAGTQGRLLAGRLATNLGSPRLGQALVRLAWRNDRESLYAGYFHTLVMFRSWGPLRTWKTLRSLGDYASANESLRADWHGLWAHVLAALRDHDRAERHLEQALELSPNRPWTWVQRSAILTMGDRPEEALAASRKAMELRPFYRPAVQSLAAGLLDLGRDQEALSLLTEAATRLECGDVIAHMAAVQIELRMYAEARESYERLAPYYPLMDKEKHLRGWLASRRSDAAYFCGDYATAAALAREVPDSETYQAFAKRLEESTDGKRQMLNVGFVR
ncbi:MAG: tetratricopeptide repeat protein, partial [Planctomycetes bacterium]|nr:tetratricopeptide repeat protein [Planctomycetota bacterium]